MKKRNNELLMEMELQYKGELELENYDDLLEFLESLYVEGIIDEIERNAYENIIHNGKCSEEEYTYVKESIKLWSEDEYFRRLDEVDNF